MEYKVIRNSENLYYNPKKDDFQKQLDLQCLLEENSANLFITYMDDCVIETYKLIKI